MDEPLNPDSVTDAEQEREEKIFETALEKKSGRERAAFLEDACHGDASLRARINVLLEGHFEEAEFLPEAPEGEGRLGAGQKEAPSRVIGRYKLLERIGEGGFGEVWMADQREPVKRRVAVKIIKPGMDTRQVVARFEAERQALAMMDHPNIARVLDGGATESGSPYFVMELVSGTKITEYCELNTLDTKDRLKLFVLVCQAIQHAHQKGIVHRDIKPSNVLITVHDGVPVPKVIDFGIAKALQGEPLTDKTVFTQFQHFIGTPAYISPEQAEISGLDIDTRSDIYSLGVLLYELLVGQTPLDAREMMRGGMDALRRMIREQDPVRPSTRLSQTLVGADVRRLKSPSSNPPATEAEIRAASLRLLQIKDTITQLKGDLDWIVMKCLEKDRARRYETANGLARDIERYLAGEPVVARPPTSFYRLQKLVLRHRLAFAGTAFIAFVLLLGVSAIIYVQHRANVEYRQRLYTSEVGRAGVAWHSGQFSQMLALLDQCPAELRNWEWHFLQAQANLWKETSLLPGVAFTGALLSSDGHSLVLANSDNFRVFEFPNGQWRFNLTNPPFSSWRDTFAVSPAASRLAILTTSDSTIRIWDLKTGQLQTTIYQEGVAHSLTWTPDGRQIASSDRDGFVRIWDATNGHEERSFAGASQALALAFSPDGKTLAVGASEAQVQLWDLTHAVLKRTLRTHVGSINRLNFSPNGQKLAVGHLTFGGFQRFSRVWDLEDGESLDLNTSGSGSHFDFSPDGRRLLVGDEAGMLRVWDLERRVESDHIAAHFRECWLVRFLDDGRILSAGGDNSVKIWENRPALVTRLTGHTGSLRSLAFSPESRWLASAGLENKVHLWNVRSNTLARSFTADGGMPAVAFSPNGRVGIGSEPNLVQVWNPETVQTDWSRSVEPGGSVWWLAFSPDQQRLFAASENGRVTIFQAENGAPLGAITGLDRPTDGLAVSPDGLLLAILQKRRLSVWKSDGSAELWQAPANLNRCAVFSPDGDWIATGGQDRIVTLWNVSSAARTKKFLRGHASPVTGVAFSPDGRRVASSGMDTVKLWDPQSASELISLPLEHAGAWHVAFSPDGKSIAAAGGDGAVTLWKIE